MSVFASTISSLYFVACTATGICHEQRVMDLIEIGKPTAACARYIQRQPLEPELVVQAEADGNKISLRCDGNTEALVKVTDASAEAWLTSCGPTGCVTDKLAMFNGQNQDDEIDHCESAEQILAPAFIEKRKAQGYKKFSYNCFPTVEAN